MKKTLLIGIILLISVFALQAQSRLVVWCHGVPTYYNVSDVDSIVFENSGVPQTLLPTVTTSSVTDITDTSATCGGNVTSDDSVTVIARGVCWSTSQNPTVADSHTEDGTGTGSFISSLTGLMPNTTYYVRAYATNEVGTAYGSEVSFTTPNSNDAQPCPGNETVTDIDGNVYNTVQIGQQCWMRENLRTTKYADGTEIPVGDTISSMTPYRYAPNNDESNIPTYGYLYNWAAVMHGAASSDVNPSGVQGICPTGWHVPSDAEWIQLTDYVSGRSQYVCGSDNTYIAKALTSTTGWESDTSTCAVGNDLSANNATFFSALPAGYYSGNYYDFARRTGFWSATENDSYDALYRFLGLSSAAVLMGIGNNDFGFSVRCLLGEGSNTTSQLPTVTTTVVSNIAATSATCGGNVTSDGGASVTARGVCWSTSSNPTISDSHTEDGTGTGNFTSSLTGLTTSITYYVRAYATNSWGTAYGNEVIFTTVNVQPCPNTPTLTDIDGNVYNTVQIGNQCWMRENLYTRHYADNTDVINRYAPNNDLDNVSTNGYLYDWYAVMHGAASSSANPSGVQGICPTGWHVPSDAEWIQLREFVGSQSEYVCGSDNTSIAKALASQSGWLGSTNYCTPGNASYNNNATGFGALPVGLFWAGGYGYSTTEALFWATTEYDADKADFWRISCDIPILYTGNDTKAHGYSVRCLRDESITPVILPTVTTSSVTDITDTSATCGGNVTSDDSVTLIARGVCWSTSPNPTISDSHTIDGSGMGSFTSSLTGLTPNTTYYVRAYATNNSVVTAYGEELNFTTVSGQIPEGDAQPCPGNETVTDIDGNVYNTVQIGQQCWMRENLRTTHYMDNTEIPVGDTISFMTPYRYTPNNDESNVPTYGCLYNWAAVMHGAASSSANPSGVQGICPTGWHVPSDAELTQLTDYVSSQSAYTCGGNTDHIAKSLAATTGWNSDDSDCAVGNDLSANNATGFSAFPAGGYYGCYNLFGLDASFWSATEVNSDSSFGRYPFYNSWFVAGGGASKGYGFSVRCLRD